MNGLLCDRCGWVSVTYELASTHHLFCPALGDRSGASEGGVRSPSAPATGCSGHLPLVGREDGAMSVPAHHPSWGQQYDGTADPDLKT